MELKNGQIFVDKRGSSSCGKIVKIRYSIFEYDEKLGIGTGLYYNVSGSKGSYSWACPEENKLFKNIPKDILYSFKHGSRSFLIDEKDIKDCDNYEQLIRKSNFKFVTKKTVENAKFIESINTISKIKQNWAKIKSIGFSGNIMNICLRDLNIPIPGIVNGELGLQHMDIIERFNNNFRSIDRHLNNE